MPIVTAIAPEPRKKLRALMNNWPRRAAFWFGFLQAIRLDNLKG